MGKEKWEKNYTMKDYNEIICGAYQLIIESSRGSADINIPRPSRLKTPPNTYGSSGQNAQHYDMYIQDQAEEVYQDKYGKEKGTNAWNAIIGVGNAMFKACDQILGEKRTLTDMVGDVMTDHAFDAITDEIWNKAHDSYICLWCAWILAQKAAGYNYTQDFLSECIPTFKGVVSYLPGFLEPFLQKAGVDLNNFNLSKKVKTAVDLKEKVRQQLAAIDAAEKAQKEAVATNTKTIIDTFINSLPEANSIKAGTVYPNIIERLTNLLNNKSLTKLVKYDFNGQKDNDRIVNILRKSLKTYYKEAVDILPWMIDINKAQTFAENMNKSITGEDKRAARKKAAEDLGVNYIANCFVKPQ